MVFHPQRGLEINPGLIGMAYEDVAIRSGENFIHGWFFPGDSGKYLVYYHGNAGTIADRIEFAKFLAPLKLNILMVDYRGYGRSEGEPTIEGFIQDAKAAAGWMVGMKKAPLDKTIYWGHSLGGAAALIAASTYPGVAGVIAESSFISLRRLSLDRFAWIPVVFVSSELDNGSAVEKLATPKLFIHGTKDTVIPFHHSEELHRRAMAPKMLFSVEGATHSDVSYLGGQKYLGVVGDWIEERTKSQ